MEWKPSFAEKWTSSYSRNTPAKLFIQSVYMNSRQTTLLNSLIIAGALGFFTIPNSAEAQPQDHSRNRPSPVEHLSRMLDCSRLPPSPPPGSQGRQGGGKLLLIYDQNGDGQIDDAERSQFQEDLQEGCLNRKARLIAEYDQDGDGELTSSELSLAADALRLKMQQRRQEFESQMDSNGDGQISRAERRAGHQARRAEMTQKYDLDGDGILNEAERQTMAADLRARIRSGEFPPPRPGRR